MTGNRSRMQQQQQQENLFLTQFAAMQREQQAATANFANAQAAERARIEAQINAEEAGKNNAIKKKAATPFVRSSVLTSPFGLLSQAPTASRTFLGA